jgi:hypothetical protein
MRAFFSGSHIYDRERCAINADAALDRKSPADYCARLVADFVGLENRIGVALQLRHFQIFRLMRSRR